MATRLPSRDDDLGRLGVVGAGEGVVHDADAPGNHAGGLHHSAGEVARVSDEHLRLGHLHALQCIAVHCVRTSREAVHRNNISTTLHRCREHAPSLMGHLDCCAANCCAVLLLLVRVARKLRTENSEVGRLNGLLRKGTERGGFLA